jgi:hypothetical protein
VALQRLPACHWQPQSVLRSWGVAALHRVGDAVCVPCGEGETLWLGAWAEPAGGRGAVWLADAAGATAGRVDVPAGYALTALHARQPIDASTSGLALHLAAAGDAPVRLALQVLPPAAWCAVSGRAWSALQAPPPLPPRLG